MKLILNRFNSFCERILFSMFIDYFPLTFACLCVLLIIFGGLMILGQFIS